MANVPGIVITYPFPLGAYNGGARMTRELALNLGRRGIPVYLMPVSTQLLSRFPRKKESDDKVGYEFDGQFEEAGVHVIRVRPHILHPFLDGLMVRRALKKLLAEKPIAAVLSYYHEGIFLPNFLKSRQIPFAIIAIWQSYEAALKLPSKLRKPFQYLSAYIQRHFITKMYRQGEYIFPISNHTSEELVQLIGLNPKRIETCYLGVAPAFAGIQRSKPDQIKRILFFGRIIQSKGVADAIEALGQLKAQGYDDWEFHISGEGYPEWAQSLIVDAGLEKHVFIIEPTNDKQLHQFLSNGHLVLMPSHAESFGLSFAEAQAAGLPVIGYAAGSVPEVVAHGETGWLAPTGDIDQLTAYLIKAIENPACTYQMGLAGRERVSGLFTWQKTADTILAGLQEIGVDLPV